ncbi:MAG: hypothetical protein HY738_23820 [Bacteroidia bacterium]|nr:hypothetical protein [Bacteroidia bacterium]
MPYRRLPNTDQARLRALKKAIDLGQALSPVTLAFSQATLQKIRSFLPLFEHQLLQQQQAFTNQTTRSKEYIEIYKKTKIYISHFIQVMNMAVQRGELPCSIKKHYGLNENSKKVPSLNTESDVIKWGERIIKGEQERLSHGENPIMNPKIAIVKINYENFIEAHRNQKNLQEITSRTLNKVADKRNEADTIILNLWNEIEEKFSTLPDNERREKSSLYGLIYVYRKNEKLSKIREEQENNNNEPVMTLQESQKLDRKENELIPAFHFLEDKVNQPAVN